MLVQWRNPSSILLTRIRDGLTPKNTDLEEMLT